MVPICIYVHVRVCMYLCMCLGSRKEIFITGQNKESLNRVFSRYTRASREATSGNKNGLTL
jgi:hypothetical protein